MDDFDDGFYAFQDYLASLEEDILALKSCPGLEAERQQCLLQKLLELVNRYLLETL